MERDGSTISLWQSGIPDYNSIPTSFSNIVYDVLIVGGGITGITTGLLLQKAGKKCLVAEAHGLCFGTTGGTTAHINSFFDTTYDMIQSDFGNKGAQLVSEATRQSRALFQNHVKEYAIDCGFEEKDGYVYAQTPEQADALDKMYDASKQVGAEIEYVQKIPVTIEFQKAVVYKGQAQIHPTRYVQALAKAFEEAGGMILQNCPVDKFENENNILEIETANGKLKAKNLIWATHTPPGINILHFRLAPYRSYAIAVKLNNDAYPDALAYDMYDPYHYYRTQTVDGEKYLIAGGEDHKTAHEENTDMCFVKLEAYIREHFNVSEISYKWSSQYFEPTDGIATKTQRSAG